MAVQPRPPLRRELLRWRSEAARLYLDDRARAAEHRRLLDVLLRFTPEASRQIAYLST